MYEVTILRPVEFRWICYSRSDIHNTIAFEGKAIDKIYVERIPCIDEKLQLLDRRNLQGLDTDLIVRQIITKILENSKIEYQIIAQTKCFFLEYHTTCKYLEEKDIEFSKISKLSDWLKLYQILK